VFGKRLIQLRLARNLSLEDLSAAIGGLVTKQSLSKYELGKSQPSALVLAKIAAALGVKASYFMSEPTISVEFVAYRRSARLLVSDKKQVEQAVTLALEDRVRVQMLIGEPAMEPLPLNRFKVNTPGDTEICAERLRESWALGMDPIANMTSTLEDHRLSVFGIDTSDKFDGISAIGRDITGNIAAAAIVTRRGIAGERQRLNLAHELGHLVLKIAGNVDEEKAAFRFGSAFLAPADGLYQEVGLNRDNISLQELLILKKRYGMSMQALLYRLHDLGIITDSCYRRWCIDINTRGWKKQEPNELDYEKPEWLRRNLLRLVAEKAIDIEEARRIAGGDIDLPATITQRRAFLKLPIEKRRQILAEQAERLAKHYSQEEGTDFVGDEIIDQS
jgi:Zn-dependent peptidase ImmA (M78 family)/transcriptional regulator with XRE-family HTH domain